jgi:DNA repair protein RadD
MAFIPRPYQREQVDAGLDAMAAGEDALLVLPTGGGKSGVAGTLMREMTDEFGDLRMVSLAHVKELVKQNFEELLGIWDWAPAGVYSAGLNQRDLRSQIVFAGIQSIGKKVRELGQVDALFIDEAHMIPRKSDTTYGRLIAELRDANPDMRLCGLTATDYRLDSGRLTDPGWDRVNSVEIPPLFPRVTHEVKMRYLMDEGYLTPLSSKGTSTTLSVAGVGRRGGEFIASELQAAVDRDELNRAIADEVVEYGQGRRSWLGFAAGVEHANHLAAHLRRHGISVGVITGETPSGERDKLIADFKGYRIRCILNCGVLTTGFNHPGVDLIFVARPTESTGLYVQIGGRGTRNIYAPGFDLGTTAGRLAAIAGGPKPNCLFLDFGGLVRRHGPIDDPIIRVPGKGGGGQAPVKECPGCHELVHASVMICPSCGNEWERQLSESITRTASVAPIMSKADPVWHKVTARRWYRHSKFGSTDSVRVEYQAGPILQKEWLAVENERAAGLVAKWWKQHGGAEPPPTSVDETLQRVGELDATDELRLEPDGRYWKITGRRMGGDAVDTVDTGPKLTGTARPITQPASARPITQPGTPSWRDRIAAREEFNVDLDDEIPF